jgi:hypothetical protein
MGDQVIITDDKPVQPDVIVVKPEAEAKTEKTVVTETVKVSKTEEK